MYRTDLYNKKCLAWEDKPNVEKTWPNWKIFFTKVICDHRRHRKTAGMHYQANSVLQDNLQQDTVDELVNLVSATADDRNAVANLTPVNLTLAVQIKALNEHNTKQKEEMESLKTN
eukprot:11158224-Ditylum_brightwellii.AAC.1